MPLAVRFRALGGPDVLSVDEVDTPEPGPGEVRIRTRALALNRADVMFRTGTHFFEPRFPQATGLEAAGTVDAVGPDVAGLAVGDRVSVVPAFAVPDYPLHGELVLAPARAVVKHPDRLSWEEAAALWMAYATAYGGLVDIAGLRAGDVVVVSAASSSVGLAALQIAAMIGATPIALSRTSDKRDELLAAGASAVIATGEEDLRGRLADITGGAGVDVVFDPVGGPLLSEVAEAAAEYATIVIYGALSDSPTTLPVLALLQHRLTLRGYDVVEVVGDDTRLARAVAFINHGITTGALRPTVDRTFALSAIADAYTYLESNAQVGKVVITMPQTDTT
ncbi:NADPH:quinone reductase [Microlunatus sagamiharensis]|uniref:NADPH:quinone reductase n=1 Tax=Microlunatus sagamiharensis TaxID=546874 RepID=A0A1H2N2N4_9ACTN|nr:zinc-dependent alcohol dehydrogenase family protein [Microlunatus sagamiharensis]SDU99431.1 NADPH:quinone reductase [Microlunatus sagamiharensis]